MNAARQPTDTRLSPADDLIFLNPVQAHTAVKPLASLTISNQGISIVNRYPAPVAPSFLRVPQTKTIFTHSGAADLCRMIHNSLLMPRCAAIIPACLLLAWVGPLRAQHVNGPAPGADIPTLERVQAVRDEEEVLDLYRFRNPVSVQRSALYRAYRPAISPEEMALVQGGYINYGINLGLYKSWQGIKKVTGMRAETQPAIARPPPLAQDQVRRAAARCGAADEFCTLGD